MEQLGEMDSAKGAVIDVPAAAESAKSLSEKRSTSPYSAARTLSSSAPARS
jgi:hypothetical protein